MTLRAELRPFLRDHATVGGLAEGGVHWLKRPQGAAVACVVLTPIFGFEGQTYAGGDGFLTFGLQVDCWGGTYDEAAALADAVAEAFGELTAAPYSRPPLVRREADTVETLDAPKGAGRSSDAFRSRLDVRVWRTEP